MEIELKDLIWKNLGEEKEVEKHYKKWAKLAHKCNGFESKFYYDNSEQIAKEKAEILNKQVKNIKENIIEMFVEAGFEYDKNNNELFFKTNNLLLRIKFNNNLDRIFYKLFIKGRDGNDSTWISVNDRKSIEFYYNQFREMLKFEVENE